jgi:hypothetical protein
MSNQPGPQIVGQVQPEPVVLLPKRRYQVCYPISPSQGELIQSGAIVEWELTEVQHTTLVERQKVLKELPDESAAKSAARPTPAARAMSEIRKEGE